MILLTNNSSKIKLNIWYLLLLFSFTGFTSIAQGGFKKKYYPFGSLGSACANVIETPSGDFIALGITVDTINNQQIQRLTLIGADAQGNQLWKKSYGNGNLRYYANIEQGYLDSTGFYQAVVMQGSNIRNIGGLIKFNFQGDTVWQKVYSDIGLVDDLAPASVTKASDGGFLLTGYFQKWSPNGYLKLLLMKTDSNGNELWRKKISGTAPNWQNVIWGYGIVEDKATKRILISGYQYLGTANSYYSYGSVFCTDSLGNTLWQKAYTNQASRPLEKIVAISDGNYMAVGTNCTKYDNWGAGERWQGAVIKFDTAGNLIWNKTFDSEGYSNSFRQICNIGTDRVLITGVVDSSSLHSWYGSGAIELVKIDYSGNLLDSRIVGSSKEEVFGTAEIPRSIFHCKDKGFVLATQFPVASNPQPFGILKIDSTFCDTLEAYCRSVELAVDELQKRGTKFTIFPNPTTSQVTVQLNTDASQTLAVYIFDLSGRRVKEITIETSDTFQIPLADLEAGVYTLQVFAQGKSLGKQKLIIQR